MRSEHQSSARLSASDHRQARGSLISLMRGFFSCPTIAALAELGLVERMLAGPFRVEDFPTGVDKRTLASVFRYLQSLNLLEEFHDDTYQLTTEGRTALRRNGAFLLLFSYRSYFENLAGLLAGQAANVTVDRRINVLGSGALHTKKFFSEVWEMFRNAPPAALIDVGCGDGKFLTSASAEWPGIEIAAVDLSAVSVETTLNRLAASGYSNVAGIVESGVNVADWIFHLPQTLKACTPLVLSMWFVVHEFSGGDPQTVIRFFVELRGALPTAEIILGEITAVPPELLANHHDTSIMPEFLLFHELSRQGVLSWEMWKDILEEIPYTLAHERLIDLVGEADEETIPSSFIWHLRPC